MRRLKIFLAVVFALSASLHAETFTITKISTIEDCRFGSASFYSDQVIHTECEQGADNYQTLGTKYGVVGDEVFYIKTTAQYGLTLGHGLSLELNDEDTGFSLLNNFLLCNGSRCQGISDPRRDFVQGLSTPLVNANNLSVALSTEETVYDEVTKKTLVKFLVIDRVTGEKNYITDSLRKKYFSDIKIGRVNSDGSFAYFIRFGDGFSVSRYYNGSKFKKLRKLNKKFTLSATAREDGTVLFVGREIDFTSHVVLQKGRNIRKLLLPRGRYYKTADQNVGFFIHTAADDGLAIVQAFGNGKNKFFYYEKNEPKKLKKPKGVKWRDLSFVDMTACGNMMFINDENGDLYIYQRSICSE